MTASDDFLPSGAGGSDGRPGSSRLLRILLIVSLALNMFFLGAGAVILHRVLDGPQGRGGPFFIRGMHQEFPGPGMMLRSLPPESRTRIEAQIANERAAMKQALQAAKQARREAYAALSATPFSAEIYRQKLDASEVADLAAVRAVHKVMIVTTEALTPEERATLLSALRERKFGAPPPGGPPPPNDGGDGPPSETPPPPQP
jgi:uncharacterized membrane protein